MEPTDPYLKSKRNLVLFGSALLLIISTGVTITPGDYTVEGVKLTFEDTSFFDVAIAFIVLYFLIQISLFWSAQNAEVKSLLQYKLDFYLSFAIGCISLALFATLRLVRPAIEVLSSVVPSFSAPWSLLSSSILGILITTAVLIGSSSILPIVRRILEKSRHKREASEADLLQILPRRRWRFVFNPTRSTGGEKEITFNEDGEIGDGGNRNETNWRVRGEFVEILNSEGQVYSRFTYDPKTGVFHHTNDDDTSSLRSQRIEPLEAAEP